MTVSGRMAGPTTAQPIVVAILERGRSGWRITESTRRVLMICPGCGSDNTVKYGRTRYGTQRYQCRNCRYPSRTRRTFIDWSDLNPLFRGRRKYKALAVALGALEKGFSVRESAKIASLAKYTVTLLRRRWLQSKAPFMPMCQCGREVGHNGWCRWRFLRSERRKRFMARWNKRFRLKLVSPEIVIIPTARCAIKACPFPVSGEGTLCRQHMVFEKAGFSSMQSSLNPALLESQ